jgi:hypothetical protein
MSVMSINVTSAEFGRFVAQACANPEIGDQLV